MENPSYGHQAPANSELSFYKMGQTPKAVTFVKEETES